MSDPEPSEKQRQRDQWQAEPNKRMPFDTSDLDRIPTATEDDPPYRNWWVDDER